MASTDPTPDGSGTKEYAEEYHEELEEIAFGEVTAHRLTHKTTDITYVTGQGTTRTVRVYGATPAADYNNVPEGFYGFYHNRDKKYAYSPEQDKLLSVPSGDTTVTVAESEDIIRYEAVSYPERAVVDGAVQEGVEATVYYRSPRSDSIQSVTVHADFLEGRYPSVITGEEVDGDRHIEATLLHNRKIKTTVPENTLGRVARVEFPKGHQFAVTVDGLTDDKVTDSRVENVEQKLKSLFERHAHSDGIDVTLTHEGRIER